MASCERERSLFASNKLISPTGPNLATFWGRWIKTWEESESSSYQQHSTARPECVSLLHELSAVWAANLSGMQSEGFCQPGLSRTLARFSISFWIQKIWINRTFQEKCRGFDVPANVVRFESESCGCLSDGHNLSHKSRSQADRNKWPHFLSVRNTLALNSTVFFKNEWLKYSLCNQEHVTTHQTLRRSPNHTVPHLYTHIWIWQRY